MCPLPLNMLSHLHKPSLFTLWARITYPTFKDKERLMPSVHGLQEGETDSEPRFLVSNHAFLYTIGHLILHAYFCYCCNPAPFLFMMILSPLKWRLMQKEKTGHRESGKYHKRLEKIRNLSLLPTECVSHSPKTHPKEVLKHKSMNRRYQGSSAPCRHPLTSNCRDRS